MAHAQASDVATRLGRTLTTDEIAQTNVLLEDAEIMIKARIPDLETRITDGKLAEEIVILVEASAVARLVRNPDGYIGETDGNYSYQLNWRLNTGELTITDKEWALLGVSAGVFAFDVRPLTPFERGSTAVPAYGSPEWVVWNQSSDIFWNQIL